MPATSRKATALELAQTARRKLAAGILLDLAEVAALLDLDERTIRRGVKRGIIPRPVTMGRRIVRFRPTDVRQLIGEAE